MASEADAIPYEPSLLRGERLLVLAPHPDDEVIACGGLLAHHILEQRKVLVVVATDGARAGTAAERQEESQRALQLLGGAEVRFLGHPDRELSSKTGELVSQLAAILREWEPDLIAVPSPIEIHPDHLAMSSAFWELIQGEATLFADLAVAQVAFYEVGQPIRPNALLDISAVAEAKYAAIAEHKSQAALRDYAAFARGLNVYRTMTLPPAITHAEAYYVLPLASLRTTPLAALQHAMGDARSIVQVAEETLPITVIVRTKDRPRLLSEAVASIRAGGYPAEIVIVNDGGGRVEVEGARVVEHASSRGRSIAANEGVQAASNPYIAFLDDDDLYQPDHLATLARAARGDAHPAWYTDAVSVFVSVGQDGELTTTNRMRIFSSDFDRFLLLTDNFIPLPTLLLRRSDFLDLGGFDPEFDLFEDWDFLIRLADRGNFVHVPRITCEIRHIDNSGSITLAAREGTTAFRDAKLRIWKKHADRVTPDVFAHALEWQKHLHVDTASMLVEERGLVSRLRSDIDRLLREGGYVSRTLQVRERELATAREAVGALQAELERARGGMAALNGELEAARRVVEESQTTHGALYSEIHRLQGLLDMIYASKTWKLHELLEKVKGRG